MPSSNSSLFPSDRHMGFSSAESLGLLVVYLLWRFWRICIATILIIVLLYWMYGGLLILLVLLVTLIGALYHYQDSLLYYPEQPESARVFVQLPSSLGLPYETVCLKTRDNVQIMTYFIKQSGEAFSHAPTLIYFHGNAGNIGHRLHNAYSLFHQCHFNILLVEYRGYGKSQGMPSETGLYMDAQAALEFILSRRDIDKRKIIIFGRSLGGAVAIHLAASLTYSDKILALIVENTFTGIPHMAQLMIPGASSFPKIFFKNKFLSYSEIRRVRAPTLLLSGLADQLIPPQMMMELYQACGSSLKRIETFHGGTHNGTWTCFGYYEHVNKFLAYVLHTRSLGDNPVLMETNPTATNETLSTNTNSNNINSARNTSGANGSSSSVAGLSSSGTAATGMRGYHSSSNSSLSSNKTAEASDNHNYHWPH